MVQELRNDLFQEEVLNAEVPVLVDFWAPACGPCKLQERVLSDLATEAAGQFEVKKVNVWDETELATRFQISAVPTLLVFKNGEVVRSFLGYQDKSKLLNALQST